MNCHSELMEVSLGNIEPVQLGVKWSRCVKLRSNFPVLLTTRAEAFSKRSNLSVMVLGDPANTVLQPSIRDVMKAYTRVFCHYILFMNFFVRYCKSTLGK